MWETAAAVVLEINGKVNHQDRENKKKDKKARFSVAYLITYQSLVSQLYATKYFFSPFSSTAQLEFADAVARGKNVSCDPDLKR